VQSILWLKLEVPSHKSENYRPYLTCIIFEGKVVVPGRGTPEIRYLTLKPHFFKAFLEVFFDL
jgi:hypothetical protein